MLPQSIDYYNNTFFMKKEEFKFWNAPNIPKSLPTPSNMVSEELNENFLRIEANINHTLDSQTQSYQNVLQNQQTKLWTSGIMQIKPLNIEFINTY